MKIFFSGATSDTGNRVLKKLVTKFGRDTITCLIRKNSDSSFLEELGVKTVIGDVTEPETIQKVLDKSFYYLDMTHPKYYHKSLEAVVKSGVERAYFVTTTGIYSQYNQCSQIYKDNEAKIKGSGITYTILRPSMIYGSVRDKNMHKLIKFLSRYPIFPLFGGGKSLMQPVYVEDLATGIVSAIAQEGTENQEYNLAGPNSISYGEIIEIILDKINRQVIKINIDNHLAAAITKYAQNLPKFPVTEEQVLRLQEDKVFDISKAMSELNYQPINFEFGINLEIQEMKNAGII
jgi:nucleoside-diphosphate-sugar epimerase